MGLDLRDAEERDRVLGAGIRAPSMHNTQPWLLAVRPGEIDVYRDPDRELPVEDPERRGLYVSIGALAFNIQVAAASLETITSVRRLPNGSASTLTCRLRFAPARTAAARRRAARLALLLPAVSERRSSRLPFTDRRVPTVTRRLLPRAAAAEGADLMWIDDASWLRHVLDLVGEGGYLDRTDPRRRAERARWVGGVRGVDGVPSGSLGAAPLLWRTPVRDLGVTREDARRPGAMFEDSPQLAVLSTAVDDPRDWLRAGSALERVLLTATRFGLSTGLLGQALEYHDLRWLVRRPDLGWMEPQAIVRFGYGPPVPLTPRRPLADFLRG